MNDFILRQATIKDIPFLVETIVEAEKSGTDKLSYSTIFGISEIEAKKYIEEMLLEEIDGCELSVSSFILAEKQGQIAAAASAWIEGLEGTPSTILKGNLLSFVLPKKCIERAIEINQIIREIHIEYIPGTIQLGLVYVSKEFRGLNLVKQLVDELIKIHSKLNPLVSEMYVQVFSNNTPAIIAYERACFREILSRQSLDERILCYLPSNKKILMKMDLAT